MKTPPSASPHVRILIVDDEPVSLAMLGENLAYSGYEIATEPDGMAALRHLSEFGADIVIADWMMPEMDGLELSRRIRDNDQWGGVYIIMITALSERDRMLRAFDAGVDDFLSKPVHPAELRARVRAAARLVGFQRRAKAS